MSTEHDKKDDLLGKSIDPIYFELAGRIRGVDPEYGQYLLQKMYSLEVAKIVRELPAPAEEIAKKLNLKAENVEKTTQELVKKGYLLKTAKGPKLFGFLTQLDDIMMANPYTD